MGDIGFTAVHDIYAVSSEGMSRTSLHEKQDTSGHEEVLYDMVELHFLEVSLLHIDIPVAIYVCPSFGWRWAGKAASMDSSQTRVKTPNGNIFDIRS